MHSSAVFGLSLRVALANLALKSGSEVLKTYSAYLGPAIFLTSSAWSAYLTVMIGVIPFIIRSGMIILPIAEAAAVTIVALEPS